MENIDGNVLVTTDWHIGLKQNSKSRLNIVVKAVKEMLSYVKSNGIQNIIFAGDLFHERVAVNVNSLNVALKCIQALAKHCKIYLIVGNHDSHLKNTIDINSLNIFKDTPNVVIVDKPVQVSINGNKSLLVPWLGDISQQKKEQYDMLFGHFDVSTKYLICSYAQEHSAQKAAATKNAGDLVGDFVDIAKKKGTIFSGHIHGRKEFISRGRNFILVGDPYQQNLGEKDYSCGFYVIDSNNNYEFVPIVSTPKHIDLRISEIARNINGFDFGCVTGNIIHKIYDIDISTEDDAKISQLINDRLPYEELLPDYDVRICSQNELSSENQTMQLIKKSKLDYLKNYIDKIDAKALIAQNIDANKLFSILQDYYNSTTEEK